MKVCTTTTKATGEIPVAGPILVIWADSGEVAMDIQRLLVESAQPQSEDDIVFVAGLRRRDTQETTYTDGEPAYRIDYDVKLLLYKEAKVVTEFTLKGYPPPFVKYDPGPAYGDPPVENVAGWLAEQTSTKVRGVLGAHWEPVTCLAFNPNGKILASGSEDKRVRLWDITSGQEITTLLGYTGEVQDIAFSPDGDILASAGYELEVRLWDVTSQKLDTTIQVCDFGYGVEDIAFSPDETTLATAGWNCGGVSLWDIATGKKSANLSEDVSPSFVAFSPDGRMLAWSEYEENGNDERVILWNLETGNVVHTFHMGEAHPHCAAFTPDNRLLVIGDWDGHVTVWNVATAQNVADLRHNDWVYSVVFSPDGTRLASGSSDGDGMICVWDVTSWQKIATMKHPRGIRALSWDPDGKMLAFAGEDCLVRLWDVASDQLVEWP